MPFIRISVAADAFDDTTAQTLAAAATDLMAEVLGKDPALTSVQVCRQQGGVWTTGAEPSTPAAACEAFITHGTNTYSEQAEFIGEMDAALRRVLPGLSMASYVIVREVPAASWGYGGITQAARAAARSG